METLLGSILSTVLRSTFTRWLGITQVGVNGDIVSAEIHDHSAESFAILSRER